MKHFHNLAAFILGAVSVLAFSPFDFYWLAYISIALLFWLWLDSTPKRAAWSGWFFGLGLLGIGTFWLHVSIDKFGGVPLLLAMLLAVIFAMCMSLFYALVGWLSLRFSSYVKAAKLHKLLVIFPAIWVLGEVARGYFLTGFPWLSLGYSQLDSLLVFMAPLAGVFGVSWLLVLAAGLLVLIVIGSPRDKSSSLVIAVLIVIAAMFGNSLDWSERSGEQLSVRMVQGNVPQELKWNPAYFDSTIDLYSRLSFEKEADLVIWPETAIPAFYDRVKQSVIQPLQQQLKITGSDMVIGIPVRAKDHGYFNSMISLGSTEDRYDKRHLVPFGEYAPLEFILRPLVDYFRIPMSDFRTGESERSLMQVGQHQVGVSICYEDAFGDETAQALPDAAYLINVSNDAWFGDSLAPHQHLQIARMRAVENSRYMLRSTNTGISAIIDPKGTILEQSTQGETAVIEGAIYPHQGTTPYAMVKDWLVVIVAVASLVLLLLYQRKLAI